MLIGTRADIADYIYENPTVVDLKLQGIWISDRECPRSRRAEKTR